VFAGLGLGPSYATDFLCRRARDPRWWASSTMASRNGSEGTRPIGSQCGRLRAELGPCRLPGEPARHEFVAFYMTGDRVVAALNANVWDVTERLKALVTSERPVRDAQLADSGVPIDALVGAAA